MRRRLTAPILVLALLGLTSCIIVDDDDDDDFDGLERVTAENETSERNIDFFIDRHFEGTLHDYDRLTVEGDFEGTVELFAENPHYTWGPDLVRIRDEEHITWTLDLTRAKAKVSPTPPAPAPR